MRMGKYTENLPKGMLLFRGRTLLEWQISALHSAGIRDIVIVTGYCAEKITYKDITYVHNKRFAVTNMLETLMCAREMFDRDILVAYSDILYSSALVDKLVHSHADIGVAVDADWRDLWMKRYGTTETDLESLDLSGNDQIVGIGRSVATSEGLHHRYIGLLKFSEAGIRDMLSVYDEKKRNGASWQQSGKPFEQGYMTDLLHELILDGRSVTPIITHGGWYEFDTELDYEIACKLNLDDIVSTQ